MSVGSPLELYVMLFGWDLYRQFINVLGETGLFWLPALILLYRNWREPTESQEARDAHATSLSRMQWDLYSALFVFTVLVLPHPLTTLSPSNLEYRDLDGNTVTAADSGTTYTRVFGNPPDTVEMPVLWYAGFAIMNGLNRALITSFPDQADFRGFYAQLSELSVTDTALREQLRAFHDMCYLKALSKYRIAAREGRFPQAYAEWQALAETERDPFFIGSRMFVEGEGLYNRCTAMNKCGGYMRATSPIAGFPYRPNRDTEVVYDAPPRPAGRPYCSEWWLGDGPEPGLRSRLIDHAFDQGFGDSFLLPIHEYADLQVKAMLANTPMPIVSSDYANAMGTADWLKRGLVSIGTTLETAQQSVRMYAVVQALPIVQSLILFGLIICLPFLQWLGLYQPKPIFHLLLAIFTVKFWSVLWHAAWWLDQHLLQALAPTGEVQADAGNQLALLELLLMFNYIALPLVWSVGMAWIGYKGGTYLTTASANLTQPAESAGGSGASVGMTAAKGVVGKATKGVTKK